MRTEMKYCFGLKLYQPMRPEFLGKLQVFITHLDKIHWPTFAIAAISFAIIRMWPKKFARWVPGSIIAMILGTTFVWAMESNWIHLPFTLETIGSRFGGIPQALPAMSFPVFNWLDR